jgi:hypothetical protein
MRNNSPCKDCPERFIACSDKCPKDARGEYGYKAWRVDLDKIKAARLKYYAQTKPDDSYWKAHQKYIRRDNSGAYKKFSG